MCCMYIAKVRTSYPVEVNANSRPLSSLLPIPGLFFFAPSPSPPSASCPPPNDDIPSAYNLRLRNYTIYPTHEERIQDLLSWEMRFGVRSSIITGIKAESSEFGATK